MTTSTMLVAVSGGTASDGAVELACRFARRLSAHLEGFHVKADPFELVAQGYFATYFTDRFIQDFVAEADTRATKVRKAFEQALARHGMEFRPQKPTELPGSVGAAAVWREETGNGPALVARRARFFDLVVLGRSERVVDQPSSDTVEQTLIHSGRPVLLAPAKAPDAVGDRIAIGWDGSAAAVRAMVGALSLLRAAEETVVLSIGDKHRESAQSAVEYLSWRGVKAKHSGIPAVPGAGIGGQLLGSARDCGADLLIMGGYGHTPWREFFLGGATREILGVSLLPLLLAH